MKLFVRISIALFISVTIAQTIDARTFYVSPKGVRGNPGTLQAPVPSLLIAVRRAKPGDTVILRGGLYRMGEVRIERKKGMGGRRGQYLTIKAYPGEEPILRASERRLIIRANFVRIEGLHFIMPWRCDAFGNQLQIINNKFSGIQPKYGAIEVGGSNILIEGNHIEFKKEAGNTRDHGIYVHRGNKIVIRNNKIVGTQGYGIHIYDEHKNANPKAWARNPFAMSEYLIEGNYVANSRMRSGIIVAKGRGGNFIDLNDITVRNNVLINNAEFGVFVREGRNIKIDNNSFFINRLASILIREPSPEGVTAAKEVNIRNNIFISKQHIICKIPSDTILLQRNLYNHDPSLEGITEKEKIVGRPQFSDAKKNDFSLLSTSPAIDKGVHLGRPFSGAAPDLGAFEFKPN